MHFVFLTNSQTIVLVLIHEVTHLFLQGNCINIFHELGYPQKLRI